MIASFPEFSKLKPSDKVFVDRFNANFPPYAEWAYGTLVSWWDVFDDLYVSALDGNLVIKSSYLTSGQAPLLSIIGKSNIDTALQTLFAYQRQQSMQLGLYSLPQYTVDAIADPSLFLIEDDSDAREYILSTKMHAFLVESSMAGTRRRTAQFRRTTEECTITTRFFDALLDIMPSIIDSLAHWDHIYKNDTDRVEERIINRLFEQLNIIDMKGFGLFIDDTLHGFILYKHLREDVIDLNHIKVSYAYPGIFSYLLHSFAVHAYKNGVLFINFEQDLGIPGLRKFKTMLHPVAMYHKYNVFPIPPS